VRDVIYSRTVWKDKDCVLYCVTRETNGCAVWTQEPEGSPLLYEYFLGDEGADAIEECVSLVNIARDVSLAGEGDLPTASDVVTSPCANRK
jgi:hypothetical protein